MQPSPQSGQGEDEGTVRHGAQRQRTRLPPVSVRAGSGDSQGGAPNPFKRNTPDRSSQTSRPSRHGSIRRDEEEEQGRSRSNSVPIDEKNGNEPSMDAALSRPKTGPTLSEPRDTRKRVPTRHQTPTTIGPFDGALPAVINKARGESPPAPQEPHRERSAAPRAEPKIAKVHVLPLTEQCWYDNRRWLSVIGAPNVDRYWIPVKDSARRQHIDAILGTLRGSGSEGLKVAQSQCIVANMDSFYTVWAVVDCHPVSLAELAPDVAFYFEGNPVATASAIDLHLVVPPPGQQVSKRKTAGPDGHGKRQATRSDRSTDRLPGTEPASNDRTPRSNQEDRGWLWNLWNKLTLHNVHEAAVASQESILSAIMKDESNEVCEDVKFQLMRRLRKKAIITYPGLYVQVGDSTLVTAKMPRQEAGVISVLTELHVKPETAPYFTAVHISPFQDTIPVAYRLDLYQDCLRPVLLKDPFALYGEGDRLEIMSVQFKIMATEPASSHRHSGVDSIFATPFLLLSDPMFGDESSDAIDSRPRRRIGPFTEVYLDRPILPHWFDILTATQQHQIRKLPAHLQTFAMFRLVSEAHPSDIERVITALDAVMSTSSPGSSRADGDAASRKITEICNRYTVSPDTLLEMKDDSNVYLHDGSPGTEGDFGNPFTCAVCLSGSTEGDSIIKLPCSHCFHYRCAWHWFRRTLACPLCKYSLVNPLDPISSAAVSASVT